MKIKSIDLFAGAGGLSAGLKMAGVQCVWANEFDKYAAATFAHNFPDAVVNTNDIRTISSRDVRGELALERGELDLLVGGPPCQGFSTYGKRETLDPRNELYVNFFEYIGEFLPKVFVMENVTGILSMDKGAVIADVLQRAKDLGYNATVYTAKAEEFGVPQRRRRVFVMGSRAGYPVQFVPPTHSDLAGSNAESDLFTNTSLQVLSVRDAISDLLGVEVTEPSGTQSSLSYNSEPLTPYQHSIKGSSTSLTHHSAKRMLGIRSMRLALLRPGDYGRQLRERIEGDGLPLELIAQILGNPNAAVSEGCRREDLEKEALLRTMLHEGHHSVAEVLAFLDPGGFANKYRRLDWDEPSHTLVAHMARDCSDFVHPELNRFISVREAARLQSFSDEFLFPCSQFQQFKQIGNAVPPLLGFAVGRSVVAHLTSSRFMAQIRSSPSSASNLAPL